MAEKETKLSRFELIKSKYAENLFRVALDFLEIGLIEFHNRRNSDWQHYQVSLANLSVGIELLVKAVIAKKNLALLFTNLTDEQRSALICPDKMPSGFNWQLMTLDLHSLLFKSIDLDRTLTLLYVFLPNLKAELYSHTRFISRYRNAALHGLCPHFERYEADRVAFVALRLAKAVKEDKEFTFPHSFFDDKNQNFLEEFKKEKIGRVKKALENAKRNARKLPGKTYLIVDDWELYVSKCPICDSDAELEGNTEEEAVSGEDGPEPMLTFFAHRFSCENCGLVLEDSDELSLANINSEIDRSEDLDKWFADQWDADEFY